MPKIKNEAEHVNFSAAVGFDVIKHVELRSAAKMRGVVILAFCNFCRF